MNEIITIRIKEKFKSLVFETDSCIIWPYRKSLKGYGRQSSSKGGKKKTYGAHRLSYLIFKGEIPEGLVVCHSCDNPSCINPKHLWLGTQQSNIDDAINKGRMNMKDIQEVTRKIQLPNSKLSFEDVKSIRALYFGTPKMGYRTIGKIYNIAQSSVRKIVLNIIRVNE